tara:strand:+ start:398 stop:538 length:141 start_codon:yes stop_codon:yes gene_type:complete
MNNKISVDINAKNLIPIFEAPPFNVLVLYMVMKNMKIKSENISRIW